MVVLSVTGNSEAQPLPFLLLLLTWGLEGLGGDVAREGLSGRGKVPSGQAGPEDQANRQAVSR